MKSHLTTTPDGEIVYDPPHEHYTYLRNGELAWCCSTRGTSAGRIGPLTRIPAGVGYKREAELIKRLIQAKSKSMNGPSGKTANSDESETAPKETGSLADLVSSGERVVGAREVTTSYGRTCILEGASGKEYWGTALLLSQLEERPGLLFDGGDIVLEVRSEKGRTYRTFSRAIKPKPRRFGKGAA